MTSLRRSIIALAALLAGSCVVGEVAGPGGGGGDDTSNGTPDGTIEANPREICTDRGVPEAQHEHTAVAGAPAGPRSGLGCMTNAGCHGPQPGSTAYTFAGTVYKELGGTTPNPGAVVRIFKQQGTSYMLVAKAVADQAGNFAISGNHTDFPYITDVTACGADAVANGIRPMVTAVPAGSADCNLGGCHAVPGAMAIYLGD